VVTWQVLSRYVLGDPSAWTEEVARMLLICNSKPATSDKLQLIKIEITNKKNPAEESKND